MTTALAIGNLPIDRLNGGTLRALSTAKILRNLGVDITIVTTYPSVNRTATIDGFNFYAPIAKAKKESKLLHHFYASIVPWALAQEMKRCFSWITSNFDPNEIDLIIALDGLHNCTSLWLKRRWEKPLIIDDIPDGIEFLRNPYYVRFNELMFEEADAILTMSSSASNYIHARFSVPKNRIFLVPTIVDTEVFKPNLSGREIREKFGLYGPVVLNAGRLPLSFKVHDLVKIFQIVAEKVPDVKFLLVGEQFNSQKSRLLNHTDGHIVQVSAQPHSAMPNFIAAATVCPLIYPRHFLGTPHKAFEYMSMAKPIVTTFFPGISDLLDSENAELISSKDPVASYANGLLKLIQAPEYAEKLGKQAREKVVRYASIERASHIVSSTLLKLEKNLVV